VGDRVRITVQDAEEGVVEEILPRKNMFIRPPVANVDVFLVTVAAASPEPNLELTDRFLVCAEAAGADAVVCANKEDLSPAAVRRIQSVYRGVYPVIALSCAAGTGIPALRAAIRGKSAAFAGASGVGKTSLVGLLLGSEELSVGDVSRKTGRGRHTTRHVEIYAGEGGTRIYDTPGFTSFETTEAAAGMTELPDRYFPEFQRYLGTCRFDDCTHEHEPGCAVRAAVDEGQIGRSRYRSYLRIRAEQEEARRRRYG